MLYLVIIALVFNVFTYMYFTKQLEFEKNRISKLQNKLAKNKQDFEFQLTNSSYFSLEFNEKAQDYFNPDSATKTIQIEKLIPVVTEKLLDFNANPKGNPYVGQDQIGANKFIINKIKILNHRWIIADFSDGEYWGECLIKYYLNEDETVDFENFESFLYQN